jgi:pimeloyl-ACP methyl ester carboxylesterase
MYYEVHGEGEPLLLIIGWGSDLTAWMFQTPEFSKKYQVIVFDNRGIGRTDAPDMAYSTEMMADDTVGLMNALSIEETHILGHSMGGLIAQYLAFKYPKRVRSLILADTAASPHSLFKHVANAWVRMTQEGINQETFVRNQLPWLYTDKFFEDPKQVQTMINTMLANPYPQPAYAYARQASAAIEHDTRDRIGHITAPTLVLVGKEDILCPVKLSEELTAGIPNAELVVLEGGGHVSCWEIPDNFNQAVLEFLAEVEKGEKRK